MCDVCICLVLVKMSNLAHYARWLAAETHLEENHQNICGQQLLELSVEKAVRANMGMTEK